MTSPLPRTLEPELMDSAEDALEYDSLDHSAVNAALVEDFLALAPELDEVLDLGTGTAQVPVLLCQQAPQARVVAVDLAPSMLDLARLNVELAGQRERILLDCADAKALPYAAERFSSVLSNSIVHHVPDPRTVLAEAWRVTRPGGVLLFRDLVRPDSAAQAAELVAAYAAGATDRQAALFLASFHAALTLDEIRSLVAQVGGDPAAVQASSDRHWTWAQRKPRGG